MVASFILFVIMLAWRMHVVSKMEEKDASDFFQNELDANNTRKKNLDTLPYIYIPLELFPVDTLDDDRDVADCIRIISGLCDQKILNLTGITNTQLKMEYGVSNLDALSQYDQNYTTLVTTLSRWAGLLLNENYPQQAQALLEYAVSIQTDIAQDYTSLAKLYLANQTPEKISGLLEQASSLRSPSRDRIVRSLQSLQVDQLLT
ncbi:MAG: hypothetical protein K6G23_00405 [Lachnospiraceae bacterium]|nr:hypothetical protein [Lachnospiraceae bacterium]